MSRSVKPPLMAIEDSAITNEHEQYSSLIRQAKLSRSVLLNPFLRCHKKTLPSKGHRDRQNLECQIRDAGTMTFPFPHIAKRETLLIAQTVQE